MSARSQRQPTYSDLIVSAISFESARGEEPDRRCMSHSILLAVKRLRRCVPRMQRERRERRKTGASDPNVITISAMCPSRGTTRASRSSEQRRANLTLAALAPWDRCLCSGMSHTDRHTCAMLAMSLAESCGLLDA